MTEEAQIPSKKGRRSRRSGRAGKLPKGVLMSWQGILPRFARVREGGPGRPLPLAVIAAVALGLSSRGIFLIVERGIDSFAVVALSIGTALLVLVGLWVIIRVGLRDRDVTFMVTGKGVGIRPFQRQKAMDRRVGLLTRLISLLTLKGGQWAAWTPFTPWPAVRRVQTDQRALEIVVSGGPWDIRLSCTRGNYAQVVDLVSQRASARAALMLRHT